MSVMTYVMMNDLTNYIKAMKEYMYILYGINGFVTCHQKLSPRLPLITNPHLPSY